MDKTRLQHIIKKLYAGTSSELDREEFSEWINNEHAEITSKDTWLNVSNSIDKSIKTEIWENIQQELHYSKSTSKFPNNLIRIQNYSILKIVAFLAIILFTSLTSYFIYTNSNANSNSNMYSFEVAAGQKGSIKLADGTLVHLNSLSKISFASDYNNKDRIITLDGEAYFEVAKNVDKKFIVSCNGIEVEALGTEFNVKAYSADSIITTTLAQGKVSVSSNNQSIILLPKEVAMYNTKQHIINSSKVDDISVADYWRSEKLVFASEPLSSIAKTIERMYGVKIDIKDSELNNMKFTGTIQNNSLNIVMNVISMSYPLTYSITDSTITISAKHNAIKRKTKYN